MRPSKRSDRQGRTLCGVASAFIVTFPLSVLGAVEVPESITKARKWAAANSIDANAIVSDICAKVNAATTSRAVDQERTNAAQRKADGKYLIGSLQKTIKDMDRDNLDKQIEQRVATITAEVDAELKASNGELESLSAAYLEKKKKSDKVDKRSPDTCLERLHRLQYS